MSEYTVASGVQGIPVPAPVHTVTVAPAAGAIPVTRFLSAMSLTIDPWPKLTAGTNKNNSIGNSFLMLLQLLPQDLYFLVKLRQHEHNEFHVGRHWLAFHFCSPSTSHKPRLSVSRGAPG